MNFKTSFLAASLALGSLGSPALADAYYGDLSEDIGESQSADSSGLYMSIGVGASTTNDVKHSSLNHTTSGNWTGETGIGYRFNKNFRLEGSYAFNHFQVDNSNLIEDVSVHSKLVTAYYDFTSESNWVPYVGFGLGSSVVVTDASYDGVEGTGIKQVKLGVTHDTSSNIDLFGEIVWQSLDEVNVARDNTATRNGNDDTVNMDSFDQWKALVGLRYSF